MYIYKSLELEFFRKFGNVAVKFVICTASAFLSILRRCLRWRWFWRRRVATWISCWASRGQHLRRWLARCWWNITVTGITGHLVINLRNQLTNFHSCFCNYTGREMRNSLCDTSEECKNRTTRFWFFCFFCHSFKNRSSRPRKMSARSFSFWLTTLRFFLFWSFTAIAFVLQILPQTAIIAGFMFFKWCTYTIILNHFCDTIVSVSLSLFIYWTMIKTVVACGQLCLIFVYSTSWPEAT